MAENTKITSKKVQDLILCLTKKNIYSTLVIDIHDGVIVSVGANLKSRSKKEIEEYIEILR